MYIFSNYINNMYTTQNTHKLVYQYKILQILNILHEYLNAGFSSNLSFLRKVPPKPASARSLATARAELEPTPE